MSEGAQSIDSIPEVKRAKVMLHSRTLPTESMPRTETKCHPPNLLGKCFQDQVKDKSSTRQAVVTNEDDVPRTEGDLPCPEEVEPRRPGLRPRVRQRLSASAMAGNAFCTIAMIVLTVSACAVNPDIAIHPTAIQRDPVSRAQMLLSADMREWKDAEEKELASMKSNNVFTECNLPAGRKTVKTKWIYKKKLNKYGQIERYKARLVAQGFTQVEGIDYSETYSPVARFTSIRIVLALSALFGYKVHQMDVDTAFLNADLKETKLNLLKLKVCFRKRQWAALLILSYTTHKRS